MEEKLECTAFRGVGGEVMCEHSAGHDYFRSVALACIMLVILYNAILYYVISYLYHVLLFTLSRTTSLLSFLLRSRKAG